MPINAHWPTMPQPAPKDSVRRWMTQLLCTCTLCGADIALAKTEQSDAIQTPQWEQQISIQSTVASVGVIDTTASYRYAGSDHFEAEILVRWQTPAGQQEQILYEGIHDRPPAKVWGQGRYLCLAIQFCERGKERCTQQLTAYRHDASQPSFVEVANARKLCQPIKE